MQLYDFTDEFKLCFWDHFEIWTVFDINIYHHISSYLKTKELYLYYGLKCVATSGAQAADCSIILSTNTNKIY